MRRSPANRCEISMLANIRRVARCRASGLPRSADLPRHAREALAELPAFFQLPFAEARIGRARRSLRPQSSKALVVNAPDHGESHGKKGGEDGEARDVFS